MLLSLLFSRDLIEHASDTAFKTADNVTTNDIKKLIDQVRPATRSLQKSIIDYTATIKAKRDLIQGEPLAQPELESRRWKTIHKEYEEFSNHVSVTLCFDGFQSPLIASYIE